MYKFGSIVFITFLCIWSKAGFPTGNSTPPRKLPIVPVFAGGGMVGEKDEAKMKLGALPNKAREEGGIEVELNTSRWQAEAAGSSNTGAKEPTSTLPAAQNQFVNEDKGFGKLNLQAVTADQTIGRTQLQEMKELFESNFGRNMRDDEIQTWFDMSPEELMEERNKLRLGNKVKESFVKFKAEEKQKELQQHECSPPKNNSKLMSSDEEMLAKNLQKLSNENNFNLPPISDDEVPGLILNGAKRLKEQYWREKWVKSIMENDRNKTQAEKLQTLQKLQNMTTEQVLIVFKRHRELKESYNISPEE